MGNNASLTRKLTGSSKKNDAFPEHYMTEIHRFKTQNKKKFGLRTHTKDKKQWLEETGNHSGSGNQLDGISVREFEGGDDLPENFFDEEDEISLDDREDYGDFFSPNSDHHVRSIKQMFDNGMMMQKNAELDSSVVSASDSESVHENFTHENLVAIRNRFSGRSESENFGLEPLDREEICQGSHKAVDALKRKLNNSASMKDREHSYSRKKDLDRKTRNSIKRKMAKVSPELEIVLQEHELHRDTSAMSNFSAE